MAGNAEEFFGQSFNDVPKAEVAPEREKTLLGKAMDFFGVDFSSKDSKPVATRDTGVKPIGGKFEQVFEKLIQAESRGKHMDESGKLTTSPAGAQGITQLMPATAKKPGFGIEPVKDTSEAEYKRVGKEYLQALVGEFGGDFEKAVAAYNAGPGNVKKAVEKGGDKWKDFLPKREETLPYLKRILGEQATSEPLGVSFAQATQRDVPPLSGEFKQPTSEQRVAKARELGMNIAGALPVIGDAISFNDLREGIANKDWAKASAGALGLVPMIPATIREIPFFHGTRKSFEKHEEGLIFLTDRPSKAEEYASGAGGNRGKIRTAFYKDAETGDVFEQIDDETLKQVTGGQKGRELPADVEELQGMGIYPTEDWDKVAQGANVRRYYVDTNKTLSFMNTGTDRNGEPLNKAWEILAGLDSKGSREASLIIENTKRNKALNWADTKPAALQRAWKEVIIPQLKNKGYDSIEFWDDMHPTLAVFENKQLMSKLPKNLKTQEPARQEEAIERVASFLRSQGRVEEAEQLMKIKGK